MIRRTSLACAVLAALVLAGCAQQAPAPPTADEAFTTLKAAFGETEDPAEKARLSEEFLADYPAGEHSGTVADVLAYYLGEELGQKEKALQLVQAAFDQIEDPLWAFDVSLTLNPLAHELGQPVDASAAATRLAAVRPLTYSEHQDMVDMAQSMEAWELAESHAAQALELATAEAYRAENPDAELTDDELADRVARRRENALVNQGWALSNLGRLDEAQGQLEAAAELATTNYLGVATSDVNTYLGKTVLAAGEVDRALELLAPDAVMGDRDLALDGLREAFAAKHGSEDGFDEFLWSKRLELARSLDSFTLPDYDGQKIEVPGGDGNVMLLAFWFPT